jgi:hypothetical protein
LQSLIQINSNTETNEISISDIIKDTRGIFAWENGPTIGFYVSNA